MSDVLLSAIVAVVMILGLAGVVIPVLPGLTVIWAAALAYGFAVGFGAGGVTVMIVLSILVGISAVAGVVVPGRVAGSSGMTARTQVVGLIGAVVGFFAVPVVGLVLGALVGVLLAEYAGTRDWPRARAATIALAKGFGINTLIQLALGFVMIMVWSSWAATVVF